MELVSCDDPRSHRRSHRHRIDDDLSVPALSRAPSDGRVLGDIRGCGEPEQYPTVRLLLHVLYGGVGGGVFGVDFSLINFKRERDRRLGALGLSMVYGLVLSVFGTQVISKRLLGKN